MTQVMKSIHFATIILSLFSLLMARICLFNTFYCVGIAYIGSMFFSKETRRWSAVLGIVGLLTLTTFDFSKVKYILIIILLIVLRELMGLFKYPYNLKNQLLITAISLLTIEGMSSIVEGITLYKIMVAVLEVMSTLAMMSAFHVATDIIYKRKDTVLVEYEAISIAFLIACLLCGMIDCYIALPSIGKIYLRDILAFVVLIGSIYLGGMGTGTMMSIIISSVLVIIGYIPVSLVPVYIFAALIGSVYHHLERIGIIFAMALGLILGFALFNGRVIDRPIMGAYMMGSIISLLIPKNYFGMANWYNKHHEVLVDYHLKDMQSMTEEKISAFATTFRDLARQIEHLPYKQYKIDTSSMNELIESTGESICKDCTMNHFCWMDYKDVTYKSCYQMIRILDKQGVIKDGNIPPEFRKACIQPENFAYTLGIEMDLFKANCKWQKHFDEARKIMGEQFLSIADTMNDLSAEIGRELHFDRAEEEQIKKQLIDHGIHINDVLVFKGREKEIHIYWKDQEPSYSKEIIIKQVADIVQEILEIKKYEYDMHHKSCYIALNIKPKYRMISSAQFSAKQEVSGDTYNYIALDKGRYLMVLADGMGVGEVAREKSSITVRLLEKFIEAGVESEQAIHLVNSALVLRSDLECSTTVDMVLIDEYTGIAEFFKAGAAATFILREGEVIKIEESSLPIGILNHVDIVSYKMQLQAGDVLIMITDGVLEDYGDRTSREITFKHFILEANTSSPEYIARFLMSKTKALLAGHQSDDMTIVVSRVLN